MTASTTRRCDASDLPQSSIDAESPVDSWEDEARELIATAIRSVNMASFGLSPQMFERLSFQILVVPIASALVEAANGQINHGRRSEHEMVNGLVNEIRQYPNPYLALRCLPIVLRLPCDKGESQTDLASEFGVSRADVSKYCVTLADRLDAPPGRGMRTAETRIKYAERQMGKRARPRPMRYRWKGTAAAVKTILGLLRAQAA
jgi:hypothetical protein